MLLHVAREDRLERGHLAGALVRFLLFPVEKLLLGHVDRLLSLDGL